MSGQKLSGGRTVNQYTKFGRLSNVFSPSVLTHPTWDVWVHEWEFLINAFEGGQDFLRDNYLFKFHREKAETFGLRKARAYYLNYVKLVIWLWSSYIKRTLPEREKLKIPEYDSFISDIDLKHNDVNEFWIGRIFPLVQNMGMVHICLVDHVPDDVDDKQILTLGDRKDSGIRDQLIVKLPQQMVNWKKKADGSYEWCMFQNISIRSYSWNEISKKTIKNQQNFQDKFDVTYTVFTENSEYLLDSGGSNVKEEYKHGLGFVPVVTVGGKVSEQWKDLFIADMYDVCVINREIYNICSLIQEFLYKQCFNLLAGGVEMMSDEEGKIKVGLSGFVPYNQGTPPIYVSPPVDPAEFLQLERDKLIQEIYRHSTLRDKSIERKDPASGISKAYDIHETVQTLSSKVNVIEDAENRINAMLNKKHNVNYDKDKKLTRYPKEYDVEEINESLSIVTEVFKLNISEKLNQMRAVKLAKKLIPNAEEEDIKKVVSEIESGNPAERMDLFERVEREAVLRNEQGNKPKGQTGSELSQDNNRPDR